MTKKWNQARNAAAPTATPALSHYEPYLMEDSVYKALHFDGRCVQSRMRKNAPNELQFGYTRMMMGFLLFNPAPKDILIVGLGGGSLSKFCFHQLPDTVITTVEISPEVIALREEFAIPLDSERFRVICADAAEYLADQTAIADVILLDGYQDYGLPPALSSQRFYRHCYGALRDNGVVTANLWGSDMTVHHCLRRIRASFDEKMLKVRSPTSDNIVAVALKEPSIPAWTVLQDRAKTLQRETRIDFPYALDEMRGSVRRTSQSPHWLTGL